MRRLILGAIIAALVALPGAALADFAAGVAAYDTGDYATALAEWLPLAESGDAAAQRNVGHLYRKGQGTEQDLDRAADWYRRAAEIGFARAQANLGSMYLRGDGVPQDYGEAAKWFKRAAIQGHDIAQYNLAVMYERGLGVEKSEPKALAWYYNAARAGHKKAGDRLTALVNPPSSQIGPSDEALAEAEAAAAALAETEETEETAEETAEAPAPAPAEPASQEPTGDGTPASDAPAVALSESSPAGEPDADAPVTSPASATVSEWRDPDRQGDGEPDQQGDGETVSEAPEAPEGEAPAEEETAAVEQDDPPTKPNAALRFIFGFNNDILVRGLQGDSTPKVQSSAPSDQEKPEQEPSSTPPDNGATLDESAEDQDTDDREVAGIAAAPAEQAEVAIAPEAPPAPPPAPPTAPPLVAIEVEAPAPPRMEPIEVAATEDATAITQDSGPSEPLRVLTPLERWVMLTGAQTSGKFVASRDAEDGRQAPPPAPALAPPPAPPLEPAIERTTPAPTAEEVAVPPAQVALLLPPAMATPELDTAPSGQTLEANPETLLPLAQVGDAAAQYALGRAYLEGSGVEPDDVQAYLWWALAADQDHVAAAQALRSLAGRMDSAQIAAGEILIDNSKDHR